MGKGPKCETNPLPRGFNVARLLSRAVALKNMFCAFCVFPVGLKWCAKQLRNRPSTNMVAENYIMYSASHPVMP